MTESANVVKKKGQSKMASARTFNKKGSVAAVVIAAFICDGMAIAEALAPTEKARLKYDVAIREAQAEYNDKVRKAHDDFVTELQSMQANSTKAGKLEEAIQIRDEIKTLEGEGPPVIEDSQDALGLRKFIDRSIGIWRVEQANGQSRTYVVERNGRVRFVEENRAGELRGKAPDIMLDFSDGKIERWSLAGPRLVCEHWNPKAEFPDGRPVTVGIGKRLSRDPRAGP